MDTRASQVIAFLQSKVLRGAQAQLNEDTPLVSSGLLDSFALIDVLAELERLTGRRIAPGSLGPESFETVRRMLNALDRQTS